MLSQTLQKGLQQYSLGDKLRALRLKKKLGLVELGRHTGLSPAMLSKIERGRLFPTLPTLLRISLVFSVGLQYFFSEDARRRALAISRKGERVRLPEKMAEQDPAYLFECLTYAAVEPRVNAFLAEFPRRHSGKPDTHLHPGFEFLYVLKGRLALRVGNEEQMLEAGDSVYFDSAVLHSYQNASTGSSSALVVTIPA
jgi:transcriptional regulator with XRE-family HTH domain